MRLDRLGWRWGWRNEHSAGISWNSRRSRNLIRQVGFLNLHLFGLPFELLRNRFLLLRRVWFYFTVLTTVRLVLPLLFVLGAIIGFMMVLATSSLLSPLLPPLITFILPSLVSLLSMPLSSLIPSLLHSFLAYIYEINTPLFVLPFQVKGRPSLAIVCFPVFSAPTTTFTCVPSFSGPSIATRSIL